MIKNVLQYLEASAAKYPDFIALADEKCNITYKDYLFKAKTIGSYIANKFKGITNAPVAVIIDKNIETVISFMGIVYSGNFYVPIDPSMPKDRINLILNTLNPICILDAQEKPLSINSIKVREILNNHKIDEPALTLIRENSIDADPLYTIFTSGSTGTPKGVTISHRGIIDLVNAFSDAFHFDENSTFANQAPFDFDVSSKDIFNSLNIGGKVEIIPKKLFMTPKLLIEYLSSKNIDIMIWAVSALRIIADFKALDSSAEISPKHIMFSGEIMPIKCLNYLKNNLVHTSFVNLYGPTEITCNCTYFKINEEFSSDAIIPIGKAFNNTRVFLIDKNENKITAPNIVGEICVAGSGVGLGYYNNSEKTKEQFINNPTQNNYISIIYKTGDMAYYNANMDLIFSSRKDSQIKHMGHRIELGEIEYSLNTLDFIDVACCIYSQKSEKIVCFYQSNVENSRQIAINLLQKLPKYMCPNKYIHYEKLPLNKNGKIDRIKLKNDNDL